ncbi:MAG: hypothetical protein IMZ75_08595 [Actinobacteria bacterium]|nr:hypothetical protein [Actinomycetota bacterium]
MPSTDPTNPATEQRRCPVCWTWFTPNSPSNPYPRRYCCGACRIEDSRRRREREQTQPLLDAKLAVLRAARHAQDERRETTRLRHLLHERTDPMNTD